MSLHFFLYSTNAAIRYVIRRKDPDIVPHSTSLCLPVSVLHTDLHIHNLDAVPPVLVVSNHVDITSLPLQMAERLRRVQPVEVANHIKARQSPIERAVT